METFFNLEREISMATEAMAVEHNWPIKRRFTHAELAPAIQAIRDIEAAKLAVPTSAVIDAAMLNIIGPKAEPEGAK